MEDLQLPVGEYLTAEQEDMVLNYKGGFHLNIKKVFSSSGDRQAVEQFTLKGCACPVFEGFGGMIE